MTRRRIRRDKGIRISRSVAALVVLLLIVQTSLSYYFLNEYNQEINGLLSDQKVLETQIRDLEREAEQMERDAEKLEEQNERLRERLQILDVIEKFAPEMSPEEKLEVSQVIQEQCDLYGFQPPLLLALIKTESTFRADAVSSAGAKGMLQIMPFVQEEWNEKLDDDEKAALEIDLESEDLLHDPEGNIKLGTAYLCYLILRFNDVETAITAYNQGPTDISRRLRSGKDMPTVYYYRVKENYEELAQYFVADPTETLSTHDSHQRTDRPDGTG